MTATIFTFFFSVVLQFKTVAVTPPNDSNGDSNGVSNGVGYRIPGAARSPVADAVVTTDCSELQQI